MIIPRPSRDALMLCDAEGAVVDVCASPLREPVTPGCAPHRAGSKRRVSVTPCYGDLARHQNRDIATAAHNPIADMALRADDGRIGPKHKVAARQPAAREEEPGGRSQPRGER